MRPINSNKNKLNNKIIYFFHPSTHLAKEKDNPLKASMEPYVPHCKKRVRCWFYKCLCSIEASRFFFLGVNSVSARNLL